jgi:hypothetical protein
MLLEQEHFPERQVRHRTSSGRNALIEATEGGHADVVALLLRHDPKKQVKVHHFDRDGYSALMEAVQARRSDIVAMLLEHEPEMQVTQDYAIFDSDYDDDDYLDEDSPLTLAATNGDAAIGRMLLEHATYDQLMRYGAAAARAAYDNNHEGFFALLVEQAAYHLEAEFNEDAPILAQFLHTAVRWVTRWKARHAAAVVKLEKEKGSPRAVWLAELAAQEAAGLEVARRRVRELLHCGADPCCKDDPENADEMNAIVRDMAQTFNLPHLIHLAIHPPPSDEDEYSYIDVDDAGLLFNVRRANELATGRALASDGDQSAVWKAFLDRDALQRYPLKDKIRDAILAALAAGSPRGGSRTPAAE